MTDTKIPALHIAGYRVQEDETESEIGLSYVLRDSDGQIVNEPVQIQTWPKKQECYADRQRLALLAEAICRYRNAGGDDLIENDRYDGYCPNYVLLAVEDLPSSQINGWKLWSIDEDESIFEKEDKSQYLRVVDGQFTEVLTPKQFEIWKVGERVKLMSSDDW